MSPKKQPTKAKRSVKASPKKQPFTKEQFLGMWDAIKSHESEKHRQIKASGSVTDTVEGIYAVIRRHSGRSEEELEKMPTAKFNRWVEVAIKEQEKEDAKRQENTTKTPPKRTGKETPPLPKCHWLGLVEYCLEAFADADREGKKRPTKTLMIDSYLKDYHRTSSPSDPKYPRSDLEKSKMKKWLENHLKKFIDAK